MIAVAESCTGGGVGEAITRVAGSSQWFERGFIAYTNHAKQDMLKVSAATLLAHGAVSEQTAREMALGALAASRADVSLSLTGIAGPGGATPGKPVGTVCFAWARRAGENQTETRHFSGDRAAIRRQAVEHVLRGILLFLK